MDFKKRFLQIRELIWFHSPKLIHKIDYYVSERRYIFNIYFPWQKNRGLRYYEKKLTYMNPIDIKFYDSERYFSSFYFIQSGDWDLKKENIQNKIQYKIVKELFVDKLEIKELSCFDELVRKQMTDNKSYKHALTLVEKKYNRLKDVYQQIKDNGYKSQKQLNKSCENRFNTWYDEMRISIGRNGEYILSGSGNHRLMICQLLGIKSVPVIIVRTHSKYLKRTHFL